MPTIIFEFGRAFLHAFSEFLSSKSKHTHTHAHAAEYSGASYAMGLYNTFTRSEWFKNLEQQGRKTKFLKHSSVKS